MMLAAKILGLGVDDVLQPGQGIGDGRGLADESGQGALDLLAHPGGQHGVDVTEVVVEGGTRHAGPLSQGRHREASHAPFVQELQGRDQDLLALDGARWSSSASDQELVIRV